MFRGNTIDHRGSIDVPTTQVPSRVQTVKICTNKTVRTTHTSPLLLCVVYVGMQIRSVLCVFCIFFFSTFSPVTSRDPYPTSRGGGTNCLQQRWQKLSVQLRYASLVSGVKNKHSLSWTAGPAAVSLVCVGALDSSMRTCLWMMVVASSSCTAKIKCIWQRKGRTLYFQHAHYTNKRWFLHLQKMEITGAEMERS